MDCQQNIKVRVYRLRQPYFDKKYFLYTKKFCDIEQANQHIAESEMADINFNNFMGICRRDRRFFKLIILTEKPREIKFNYIEPQLARRW